MGIVKSDVLKAAGCLQLCSGHEAGAEAAVHALRAVFEDEATDGILFVDATNAFNNLNRKKCSSQHPVCLSIDFNNLDQLLSS